MPVATPKVVRTARAAGIAVHLWTINDVDIARTWLKHGVDGIITDDLGGVGVAFSSLG
jgi:glycerophosphoryl diester phosphodiesterase